MRARFVDALARIPDRLCELVPEAGAEQMEIRFGADGDVDRQEAQFPMAAVVLACIAARLAEGEGAGTSSSLPTDVVHDARAELATLLSDGLTEQSMFFDAGSRSVRVPDDGGWARARRSGDESLQSEPVASR